MLKIAYAAQKYAKNIIITRIPYSDHMPISETKDSHNDFLVTFYVKKNDTLTLPEVNRFSSL